MRQKNYMQKMDDTSTKDAFLMNDLTYLLFAKKVHIFCSRNLSFFCCFRAAEVTATQDPVDLRDLPAPQDPRLARTGL